MIVREFEDRIELITQPDHAHLAGRIMEHCVPLKTHPRRVSVLHAIYEHDNGWAEFDTAPTADPATGHVVDFVGASIAVRHGVWPRGVARLSDDPWAAALVAQHAITIYDRFRSSPDWALFFTEMEQARDAMQQRSGLPAEMLESDYPFVLLGDLVSLTFCADWDDEQQYAGVSVIRRDNRVVVTPDLFGGMIVKGDVPVRVIPGATTFRSDDDLRRVMRNTKVSSLSLEVSGV